MAETTGTHHANAADGEKPSTPRPIGAARVGDWVSFEHTCGHPMRTRSFDVDTWTVDTVVDPVEVSLVGFQGVDGSVGLNLCIEGEVQDLTSSGVRNLATILAQAAGQMEQVLLANARSRRVG
jgi:hypothetical protein